MTANELMIGNRILNVDNEVVIINELREEFYIANGIGGQFYSTSRGIPLTPEILEKCGFEIFWEYQIPLVSKGNFHMHWTDCLSANFGHIDQLDVECKYLHQLQNLYFALTGEELNINL